MEEAKRRGWAFAVCCKDFGFGSPLLTGPGKPPQTLARSNRKPLEAIVLRSPTSWKLSFGHAIRFPASGRRLRVFGFRIWGAGKNPRTIAADPSQVVALVVFQGHYC